MTQSEIEILLHQGRNVFDFFEQDFKGNLGVQAWAVVGRHALEKIEDAIRIMSRR